MALILGMPFRQREAKYITIQTDYSIKPVNHFPNYSKKIAQSTAKLTFINWDFISLNINHKPVSITSNWGSPTTDHSVYYNLQTEFHTYVSISPLAIHSGQGAQRSQPSPNKTYFTLCEAQSNSTEELAEKHARDEPLKEHK